MTAEERILGLDLGIASCGWAVLDVGDAGNAIIATGVRCWEAPEVPKKRAPKNQNRRASRGQRRVIRRKRQRMSAIRMLFVEHGLLATQNRDALKGANHDPWQLRVDCLERKLRPEEFAIALGHIANHRGFRTNSKRDRGSNASSDSSKMLSAIDQTREKLSKYRTVGEMLATDPEFTERKRNRDGDYSRTVLRKDHEDEVKRLFDRQRSLGNTVATIELEAAYSDLAFSQRPLADSWEMVGFCPFENGEKRTSRFSYSFELFRFLARLMSLRVGKGRNYRTLAEDEIRKAASDFSKTKGVTFARLRKILAIDDERFQGISPEEESNRDVVARSGAAAEGTSTLRSCLGQTVWESLLASPGKLDSVAEVLTFVESPQRIENQLTDLNLDSFALDLIMKAVYEGKFAKFRGAAHISAKAARNIIPHLMRGLTYDKACGEAGYTHTDRIETEIRNPVAKKALLEALKQVRAVVQEYGVPCKIHVEMARDIGKSAEERKAIEDGIERRNKEKDKLWDDEFPSVVGSPPTGAEDLLRFELWKQQGGRSVYSDKIIHPQQIIASDNSVQVDHILPWSRFGDDSFHNKTLCLASENQEKRGRTPSEWFLGDRSESDWEAFRARVETCRGLRGLKKRNFLLQNAGEVEERFRSRNLNDTRYAARALLARLEAAYPGEQDKRRVFARPGALTAKLRRAWGVNDLKKSSLGDRIEDDRHHALDAIVIAATTESALNRLTRAFKEAERLGLPREFGGFDLPWPSFVEDARIAHSTVFVSRPERRRARGEAHKATIKQIREEAGGPVVYERKSIDKLSLSDLGLIPVPVAYGRIAQPEKLRDQTVNSLRAWIESGKPKGALPRSPKGDVIRKVRVATNAKIGVQVRDGTADRGEMVRVDVFRKANGKGRFQFYCVPVYPHEIATLDAPPNRAVQAGRELDDWPIVDTSFEFLWAIYHTSLLELTKSDGASILGYFRGLDRNTGAVNLSEPNIHSRLIGRSIGVRTLHGFRKLTVDRLGRVSDVPREKRTWRGEVCT